MFWMRLQLPIIKMQGPSNMLFLGSILTGAINAQTLN